MAEKSGTSALAAYKAGERAVKTTRKKQNTFYFPIVRTAATFAGVSKMVNFRYLAAGIRFLMQGDLEKAGMDFTSAFTKETDVPGGIKIIATGIVLGKALDAAKVNPRVKLGAYGIKLA